MPHTLQISAATSPGTATAIGLPVTADGRDALGYEPALLDQLGFTAADGEVLAIPADAETIDILVGLADDIDADSVRTAAARFVRSASKCSAAVLDLSHVLSASDLEPATAAGAAAEGLVLGSYRFVELKSDPPDVALSAVAIIGAGTGKAVAEAIRRGVIIAEAQCLARDLVNRPGGDLTPVVFADTLAELGSDVGLEVTVWGPDEIRAERLGGLLAVNQGSTSEPRFVQIRHRPKGVATDAAPALALVGKGLTFDAGGLSIKPADGMMTMKMDMGGAAAAAAAMIAIARLGVKAPINAYLPMTDNMTGGAAQRPGDVYTARNGTTVEVLNTDAEGRLVLGDALALATEHEPQMIVDLATLTGACMVALGTEIAGLLGTDDAVDAVSDAAAASGERVWRLPLADDYRRLLDSPVADLKNIGSRYGGTITAALFLSKFVGDGIPWAHLDIAGPAYNDAEASAEIAKGGTGFGVRTLVELAASL